MAKVSRIEPKLPSVRRRKKVAAYARVSMETDRLAHSLSAQVSYYNNLIQSNPEWEFAGVFADSGISGTGIRKRDEFQKMLSECEDGNIDIILTKSISRFARNTVDLLDTVRHLKEIGVEVRFEKERISTFSTDGELMLTLLASFAQEEVRSLSENSKWGIRKTYQNGTDGVRNKKVLGYRYDGEKYVIQEDEAEIVRFMFEQTAAGMAASEVLEKLRERGAKSWRGYDFTYSHLHTVLSNEIYIGDRRLQKCYVADPIKHNKVRNRGELPQYYITDCHEPIVDRETFAKVQAVLKARAEAVPVYPFTGKIKCGICGQSFTRKKGTIKGKTYIHWICRSKKEVGRSCRSVNFSEEELENISALILGLDTFDGDAFEEQIQSVTVQPGGDLEFYFFNGDLRYWENLRLNQPRHEVTVTDCFQGKIYCSSCGNVYHRVNSGGRWVYWYCIGKRRDRVECHSANFADFKLRRISASVLGLKEFDEAEFDRQVKKITVLEDGSLEYHFYEGRTKRWQKI